MPAGSVDLAFSDQLMEHLHPDDAVEQLRNIHRALKPGGVYVCVTPNRLYGPSDISAFFDDEARGFHLKEYSLDEIRADLPRRRVSAHARLRRRARLRSCAARPGSCARPKRLRGRAARAACAAGWRDNKVMRALLGAARGRHQADDSHETQVLILVENLPSPFDRRVWQEANALRDAGYAVSIICPTGKGYEQALRGDRRHRDPPLQPAVEAEGALRLRDRVLRRALLDLRALPGACSSRAAST